MFLTVVGIVVVIGVFMFLVIIHEFGHFWIAKKSGVKVLEFGLGIPPKITKIATDKTGTEYTLNAIPLGGFVRLKGEDPKDVQDFYAPDSFISASFWRKVAILLAGIFMNFLFARIILIVLFTYGTRPLTVLPDITIEGIPSIKNKSLVTPTLTKVMEEGFFVSSGISYPVRVLHIVSGSLGQNLGLNIGDYIVAINNRKVDFFSVKSTIQALTGKRFSVTYLRSGKMYTGYVTCPTTGCLLGFSYLDPVVYKDITSKTYIKLPFYHAAYSAFQEIVYQTTFLFRFMGSFIANLVTFRSEEIKAQTQMLSGPVGVAKVVTELVQQVDIMKLILFFAMISIALGAFNLLPIPALDGGRLLSIIIQALFRFRKEAYFVVEGYINMLFFILLMTLGVIIIFKDLGVFWGVYIPFLK